MRILVVEDDPGIAFLLETLLVSNKYVVDVATDGQAGLDLSAAYEYNAIVLDVTLPKRDGINVCKEIRASGNTLPILLLTSLNFLADRTRGLDAGADEYLGKPFDLDEICRLGCGCAPAFVSTARVTRDDDYGSGKC